MNQSALISIIIGGTVAKQVQPLSLPDASSVNIQMQGLLFASIQASMHPPMPDTACHNHIILTFSKCCSSHLRPGALTCIESHDCVLFPQLDRNSVTVLIAVCTHHLMRICGCKLITCCNTDLYTPSHAQCSISQSIFWGVFQSTADHICTDLH